jgi:hypothetical protein
MTRPFGYRVAWSLGAFLALAIAPASATPYWISYEADDYPENLGWWRIWYEAPAQRTLSDGLLTMDTMADTAIAEYYDYQPGFALNPGPGETFLLQWRVRVDEIYRGREPGVTLASDEHFTVSFRQDMNSISNNHGETAYFEPGLFHTFELRTADMFDYELYVDGTLGWAGAFWQSSMPPRVGWGAPVQGTASVSTWDYVRFEKSEKSGDTIPISLHKI